MYGWVAVYMCGWVDGCMCFCFWMGRWMYVFVCLDGFVNVCVCVFGWILENTWVDGFRYRWMCGCVGRWMGRFAVKWMSE